MGIRLTDLFVSYLCFFSFVTPACLALKKSFIEMLKIFFQLKYFIKIFQVHNYINNMQISCLVSEMKTLIFSCWSETPVSSSIASARAFFHSSRVPRRISFAFIPSSIVLGSIIHSDLFFFLNNSIRIDGNGSMEIAASHKMTRKKEDKNAIQ